MSRPISTVRLLFTCGKMLRSSLPDARAMKERCRFWRSSRICPTDAHYIRERTIYQVFRIRSGSQPSLSACSIWRKYSGFVVPT